MAAMVRVGGLAGAVLAAVLASGACSSSPAGCGRSCPPPSVPRLGYVITVNGQAASVSAEGIAPRFRVRPGQRLLITVELTVPRHVRLSELWLGISAGNWGVGPKGPVGVGPVLGHVRRPLDAGSHSFGLRWRIPQDQRRASGLFLIAVWSAPAPSPGASVAQAIARLTVP